MPRQGEEPLREPRQICRQAAGAQRERRPGDVVHRAVARPRQPDLSHVTCPRAQRRPRPRLIPLVATRHMRYFSRRLHVRNGSAPRYTWNYNDDVPDPHVEDTAPANLDMFHVDVLRRGLDRLDAIVAPMGEPIPLDDSVMRRLANTFLQQIARPAEIDRGGDVRGNVNGDATEEKDGKRDRNNPVLDGWLSLAVADATVYRVCRDVLLRIRTRAGQPGRGLPGVSRPRQSCGAASRTSVEWRHPEASQQRWRAADDPPPRRSKGDAGHSHHADRAEGLRVCGKLCA